MTAVAPLPSRRNQLRARRNGTTTPHPPPGAPVEGHGGADARLPGDLCGMKVSRPNPRQYRATIRPWLASRCCSSAPPTSSQGRRGQRRPRHHRLRHRPRAPARGRRRPDAGEGARLRRLRPGPGGPGGLDRRRQRHRRRRDLGRVPPSGRDLRVATKYPNLLAPVPLRQRHQLLLDGRSRTGRWRRRPPSTPPTSSSTSSAAASPCARTGLKRLAGGTIVESEACLIGNRSAPLGQARRSWRSPGRCWS